MFQKRSERNQGRIPADVFRRSFRVQDLERELSTMTPQHFIAQGEHQGLSHETAWLFLDAVVRLESEIEATILGLKPEQKAHMYSQLVWKIEAALGDPVIQAIPELQAQLEEKKRRFETLIQELQSAGESN